MESETKSISPKKATLQERIREASISFTDPLPFFLFLAGLITAVGLVIYGIQQLTGLTSDEE
jgi:hypothetical protein